MSELSSQSGSSTPGEPPTSPQLNSQPPDTFQEKNLHNPPGTSHAFQDNGGQQLEYRGRSLAQAHSGKVQNADKSRRIQSHIAIRQVEPAYAFIHQYQDLIEEANRRFRSAADTELGMSIAAEWMLDNAYIVLQALREVQKDLPPSYYFELPYLSAGIFQGYPRVYALAHNLIEYENAAIDIERLKRYIRAYQEVDRHRDPASEQPGSSLTMGELWALPAMLRLGIIENLALCVSRLTGQLDPGKAWHIPTVGLNKNLHSDQIVANCVLSLRGLGAQDWKKFFEDSSQVELILRGDPPGIYGKMDFETRDRYRKAVEELARLTGRDERLVARKAVKLALEHGTKEKGGRKGHLGYYVLDKGRSELEESLGYRPGARNRFLQWLRERPTLIYLGSVGLITGLLAGAAGVFVWASGNAGQAILAVVLSLVPAMTAAVDAVNLVITHRITPTRLPKMDFRKGIQADCRTLVVIPVMLSSPEEVKNLLEQLELHFLRNQDEELGFALVTDFVDAPQKQMPGDDELLAQAVKGIKAFNTRYQGRFFLFHRERLWNPCEGVWMGWERKRGKLHELNQLILGSRSTTFTEISGDLGFLTGVRYVITLDADTILPKDSAARLVAAMAHPLNNVEFNEQGEVIAGYTVLQPRIEINPASANRSLFTRLFTGASGLDLYTLAVSDIYQDLFGEGIYIGKGIYDVGGFERSLQGRVPENALLSHDLFEGNMGRAALVTDIMLVEDFPANYLMHARRQTRWVRGDWQLLPWLVGRRSSSFRNGGGGRAGQAKGDVASTSLSGDTSTTHSARRRLSLIGRWKIFDNLRRSLVGPALFIYFIGAWLLLPGSAALWTMAGVLSLGVPMLADLLDAVRSIATSSLPARLLPLSNRGEPSKGASPLLRDTAARWLLTLVFLPYETLLNTQAILITLVRLLITHRHMLRWTTSAQTALHIGEEPDARLTWGQMTGALALAVVLGIVVALANILALIPAIPLLAAWLASPEIAHFISQPVRIQRQPLNREQIKHLRALARLTWLYFERFVGPEDHWLPPDHFQEAPLGVVAHRTSPTNIGLLLVSTLAAYDLGYVDLLDLGVRIHSTLDALENLERYRGHYLNWFDTRSLTPLQPRYVSTVDSGNLAACLISLTQGMKYIGERPLLRKEAIKGLLDSLSLITGISGEISETSDELRQSNLKLKRCLENFEKEVEEASLHLEEWPLRIKRLSGPGIEDLDRALINLVEAGGGILSADILGKLRIYTRALGDHLDNLSRESELLAPWMEMMAKPPAYFSKQGLSGQVVESWAALQETLKPSLLLREVEPATRTAQASIIALINAIRGGEGTLEVEDKSSDSGQRPSPAEPDQISRALEWCNRLSKSLENGRLTVKTLLIGFELAARQTEYYIGEMDFGFLFDAQRQVFHIGYNIDSGKLDDNYYDLLASEARLTSLVAIAKGDVPLSHWLHMARPLTLVGNLRVLLSWSATMFEYLMPTLLAPSYAGTLLQQSVEGAVKRQIQYGSEKNIPWGISESGYYRFDANQFYQYRAFGVPGLGYKRGMGDDLVVTPYASLLALPLEPQAVVKNLDGLNKIGMMGTYGYYESVDFTPRRASLGENFHIVRSFMAHHQGMIFLSLANFFTGDTTIRHFHADARIRSVDLLLQEHIAMDAPLEHPLTSDVRPARPVDVNRVGNPWRVRLQAPQPRVQFLSNGRYGVLVTSAGGGYSSWQDIDLTRWREDTTRNHWGTWIYIKDEDSEDLWSVGFQPTNVPTGSREAYFNAHMTEFHRQDYDIAVTMEITVPPGDDLEVRVVSLTNHSDHRRRLKLVSYGEVVLAERAADRRHPAFNKLFIESEYLDEVNALIFRRRLRSETESPVFLAHALVVGEGLVPSRAYDSDRMRFLGRGRTSRAPGALLRAQPDPLAFFPSAQTRLTTRQGSGLQENREPTRPIPWLAQGRQNQILEKLRVKIPVSQDFRDKGRVEGGGNGGELKLGGTVGGTLDPIFALGQEIELEGHTSCQVAFLTIAGHRRDEVVGLARRYQSWQVIRRAFDRARLAAEVELRQIGLDTSRVQVIQRLLSLMLYPHMALRASPDRLAANVKGQSGLWPFAISGDYPILLVCVSSVDELSLVHEVLQAHAYWRNRRLKIDLIILNEMGTDYGQELNRQLHILLQRTDSEGWLNRRGGIFLLVKDQMNEAEHILLETAARAILNSKDGPLEVQLERMMQVPQRLPVFIPPMPEIEAQENTGPVERPAGLLFDNEMGGFSPDGKEYVIYLKGDQWTPTPWINVIANPDFGFLVSEAGSGATWSMNSGENRLTPWNNDPVCDQPGEVVYLRDEESGVVWSPTPLPVRELEPYVVRHGAGYSIFEHNSHGLKQTLHLFASLNDPIKIVKLRLENTWSRTRRITITYYVEWVLGVHRDISKPYVVPEYDGESQALLARNAYNNEFRQRVAFAAASKTLHGLTADRAEFLGRLGGLFRPAALTRIGLSSNVEAGRDPCAALQLHVDLPPGETEEVYFLLGEGEDRQDALRLVGQYQQADQVKHAWEEVKSFWDGFLGQLQVSTPDTAMDLMLNRWLLYQALACRLWGRTALYQSSGAYGFRDQLQDAMAMSYADPQLLREQILRSARRQFEAGDVLHWWHPPTGRGVRTHISDDLLWLPYSTAKYIQASGDESILDEKVPFIKAPALKPGEVERYDQYSERTAGATLYKHCLRALMRGATSGPHGLPLMGSGDWNDGMNRVGGPALPDEQREGRGESVWLGWFLYDTLNQFAPLCERRGDEETASRLRGKADQYRTALEGSAWDGEWYLRAFYDDGSPLGSARRQECQIDSIAQSWAVISGGAEAQHGRQAMKSVIKHLVKWNEKLLLLFTPPFNHGSQNPGYIKGYLPGIRENGGQYTHAAIWTAWAMADQGDGDTAGQLFRLLNPINHAGSPGQVQKYRVEPYTIAADIYSEPPHTGRGGWTWYTGSAGWMYRLGVERLLGFNLEGEYLRFDPCIPKEWREYRATFRHCGSVYEILVENPEGVNRGVKSVDMDGRAVSGDRIRFTEDGGKHAVKVTMGEGSGKQ